MDEQKVKRIFHPLAVPAADLFKGGKQRARVSTASDELSSFVSMARLDRTGPS